MPRNFFKQEEPGKIAAKKGEVRWNYEFWMQSFVIKYSRQSALSW